MSTLRANRAPARGARGRGGAGSRPEEELAGGHERCGADTVREPGDVVHLRGDAEGGEVGALGHVPREAGLDDAVSGAVAEERRDAAGLQPGRVRAGDPGEEPRAERHHAAETLVGAEGGLECDGPAVRKACEHDAARRNPARYLLPHDLQLRAGAGGAVRARRGRWGAMARWCDGAMQQGSKDEGFRARAHGGRGGRPRRRWRRPRSPSRPGSWRACAP